MRRLLFIPLLLLVATAERCPDSLQKIAEGLNDAAVVTAATQDVVIAAWKSGVITKAVSDIFIEDVTIPILSAIGHANQAVKALDAKEDQNRDDLLEILPPVIEALQAALADEKIEVIKNDATRASIQLSLQGLLTTLITLQAVTEVNAQ